MLAGAVALLALPSAVLAFSTRFEPSAARDARSADGVSLAVAPGAAGLAPSQPLRSLAEGPQFPFTPAGTANRPNRSVTVAVRVDPQTVQVISVLAPRVAPQTQVGQAATSISPTAFNLGVSRGYRTFAKTITQPGEIARIDMPDLATFGTKGAAAPDSRFSPRIVMDEKQAAGRAPRTFSDNDNRVDVGGSYRVTRNLDVTAGVRYSQDRERLRPITDGNLDNQAVYVGTQFRF